MSAVFQGRAVAYGMRLARPLITAFTYEVAETYVTQVMYFVASEK